MSSSSDSGRQKKDQPANMSLKDLWKATFPFGSEWDNMDRLCGINWDFSNLEKSCAEGGELYGKKVYMFGCTEYQLLEVDFSSRVTPIPSVVAVVSTIPPSDKIGAKSLQTGTEHIIPMEAIKMAWIPYTPLENRQNQVDRLNTRIYTMGSTMGRSGLKLDLVKEYDCLPYFQRLNVDEDENDTVVCVRYNLKSPIVFYFDWELDDLEAEIDELVKNELLREEQEGAFKEQVTKTMEAQQQAINARREAIEDMNPETKAEFENMRFYKFYPVQTRDTPDIRNVKVPFINRYYRNAHVLV